MREWKMVTDVMDIKLSLFTMLKSRKYFHFWCSLFVRILYFPFFIPSLKAVPAKCADSFAWNIFERKEERRLHDDADYGDEVKQVEGTK